MINKIRLSCLLLSIPFAMAAEAHQCNVVNNTKSSVAPCDVSFTAVPTYVSQCLATIQSGIYTIRNNTPVSILLNYIRIQDNDALPAAASVIVTAPTNPCGTSLAAGASCNIQVNLQPLALGTYNRVLQVGVNTRQVEIDGPPITSLVNCTPAGPAAPADPTIPGTDPTLFQATILGASTVTNTGPSAINGDVDVSPGTAITGFPPGTIVNGTTRSNDATAIAAHADAQTYFTQLNLLACGTNLTGQNLGGLTLLPGVYCFDSSAQLTGTLTLSGAAGSNFTFKIGSTLTTASASNVILSGGVTNGTVNWAVGSSATLGTNSAFQGIIDAQTSITLTTGASLAGRAWALDGAVTLDTNVVNPN